jgi:hypothetical protein
MRRELQRLRLVLLRSFGASQGPKDAPYVARKNTALKCALEQSFLFPARDLPRFFVQGALGNGRGIV